MPESITIAVARRLSPLLLLFFLSTGFSPQLLADTATDEASLQEAWKTLTDKSYSKKEKAITLIARQNTADAYPVMKAMLEGKLYFSTRDKTLYVLSEEDNNYSFTPLFAGQSLTQESKRGFKKVKINNRLRTRLRQALALLQLQHEDKNLRLAAVQELLKKPDSNAAGLIQEVVETETDAEIRTAMRTLLAVIQLDSANEDEQQDAIEKLADSLNPSALNALSAYQPPNTALKKLADAAIQKINDR
ncbi:hypothetical protein MNBD_GAMMA14-544, partial [hydrothermal vent metagenome]